MGYRIWWWGWEIWEIYEKELGLFLNYDEGEEYVIWGEELCNKREDDGR